MFQPYLCKSHFAVLSQWSISPFFSRWLPGSLSICSTSIPKISLAHYLFRAIIDTTFTLLFSFLQSVHHPKKRLQQISIYQRHITQEHSWRNLKDLITGKGFSKIKHTAYLRKYTKQQEVNKVILNGHGLISYLFVFLTLRKKREGHEWPGFSLLNTKYLKERNISASEQSSLCQFQRFLFHSTLQTLYASLTVSFEMRRLLN